MRKPFSQAKVFPAEPLGGNPLAVVHAAEGLGESPAASTPALRTLVAARSISAYLCALAAFWAAGAAALDRQGAIDIAKRQVGNKCSSATPCTFDAKFENKKWQVRVEFTKRSPPQDKPLPYPGGHAIFIIDQNGKVVGRVESK